METGQTIQQSNQAQGTQTVANNNSQGDAKPSDDQGVLDSVDTQLVQIDSSIESEKESKIEKK